MSSANAFSLDWSKSFAFCEDLKITRELDNFEYYFSEKGVTLPDEGQYATGHMFIDREEKEETQALFTEMAEKFGIQVGQSKLRIVDRKLKILCN